MGIFGLGKPKKTKDELIIELNLSYQELKQLNQIKTELEAFSKKFPRRAVHRGIPFTDEELKDMEHLEAEARIMFKKLLTLERVQKMESEEIRGIIRDNTLATIGIANDLKMQKLLDTETLTIKAAFDRLLAHFRLERRKRKRNPDVVRRAISTVHYFFDTVGSFIAKEIWTKEREIGGLKAQIKGMK